MSLDANLDIHVDKATVTTVEYLNSVHKGTRLAGHKCPHCGESYYMENYTNSTCVYYPPIYKDGVNINPDSNIHTVCCTCLNCKKDFSYQY